jgi:hypothetical protein
MIVIMQLLQAKVVNTEQSSQMCKCSSNNINQIEQASLNIHSFNQ